MPHRSISFAGTTTPEVLARTFWLTEMQSLNTILWFLLAGAFASLVLTPILLGVSRYPLVASISWFIAVVVFAGAARSSTPRSLLDRATKHIEHDVLLQERSEGAIDDAGFRAKTRYSHVDLPWEAFNYRLEEEGLVLLMAGRFAYILPRQFFASDADWDAVRLLVHARVPTQKEFRDLASSQRRQS